MTENPVKVSFPAAPLALSICCLGLFCALGHAGSLPTAAQVSAEFYSLQLRGLTFEAGGQLAEVFVYDDTFDAAAFGAISIVNANTQQTVFSASYGNYGGFESPGTFSESFLLPYATPLNISISGQEFSNMSIIYGDQTVASGGTFNSQFPSFSTSLTIDNPLPVANNDRYSTLKDQPVPLNFLANDVNVAQLDSVANPAHGSLRPDGGGFIYTPAAGFVGTDSFSYTVSSIGGLQDSATVTIVVADAALIDAAPDPLDTTLIEVLRNILTTESASPALLERVEGISLLLNQPGGRDKVNLALQNLAHEETITQALSGSRLSRIQVNNINQRLIELRGGATGISLKGLSLQVDGQALPAAALAGLAPYSAKGGAAGDGELFERLGLFVNGQFETGERVNTPLDPGYRARTYGVSAGADYWLTRHLLLGMSGGYGYTGSKLDANASQLDIDAYTVSGFGSYTIGDNTFVDFIANGTFNAYKSARKIAYVDAFGPVNEQANARVQGMQQRYSSTVGYDYPWQGWIFGLRGRGEYSRVGIDAYREQGAGGLNLAIGEQTIVSATSGLGVIVNYALSTPFGVLSPQINLEWEHEYQKDARRILAHFVDDQSGSTFSVRSGNPDRDYLNLRSSLSATLPNGGSAFIQYETVLSLRNESRHAFNAGVRFAF
ncbi:autotransporter domain-containing protein [Methylomonas sp. SURF-2]|uniref:Autotransporter domain-containing protein n=1 Tax=Methylomonas subterranea TaxID=2952225 RepID=A0ABT1TK19_9GAMM|nr:autotransporter domain-containing protein [Methylomonas sp. SURF-2]MCQ8105824.1 autotransporter domain-containing protein [Methylomonas sp. SURF-2]